MNDTASHSPFNILKNLPEPERKLETIVEDNELKIDDPMRNNAQLFNNPVFKDAEAKMDPKMKENYKQWGKNVHSVDYENLEGNFDDAVARALACLKSGLYPSELLYDELIILDKRIGKNWCVKFDYSREEIDKILQEKAPKKK